MRLTTPHRPRRLALLIASLLAAAAAGSVEAGTVYSLVNLGIPPGGSTSPFNYANAAQGINNEGNVVGNYVVSTGTVSAAFLWFPDGNGPQRLAGLGTSNSVSAINNNAGIVGNAGRLTGLPSSETHAQWWDGGQVRDLTTLGVPINASVYALNDSAQMAGSLADGRVFMRTGSSLSFINSLNGDQVRGMNNAGQLVGYKEGAQGFGNQAFSWTAAAGFLSLAPLSGDDSSEAYGVNNLGQIVGISYKHGAGFQGVIWQPGTSTATALSAYAPTANGALRLAYGINDFGQIVGQNTDLQPAVLTPDLHLTWIGGNGSSWSSAANWDALRRPDAWLDVTVGALALSPVQVMASSTVRSLTLGDVGVGQGALELGNNVTLRALQGVTIHGGTLLGSGTLVADTITNDGNLALHGSGGGLTLAGLFDNQGNLSGSGTVNLSLQNSGAINKFSGADWQLTGEVRNGGLIQVVGFAPNSGALIFTQRLINRLDVPGSGSQPGVIHVRGPSGSLQLQQGADLSGTVDVTNGGHVQADGVVNVTGSLRVADSASWSGTADIVLDGVGSQINIDHVLLPFEAHSLTQKAGLLVINGTLATHGGAVTVIGGTVKGNGFINGDLVAGSLTIKTGEPPKIWPGNSPGHLTVSGSFSLLDGAELQLEVQRAADGSLIWDHLTAGSMSFGAGSSVHFIVGPGVAGASWQTLSFLDCGSGCSFENGVNLVIDGAPGATVQFSSSGLSLAVAPAQAVPEPGSAVMLMAGLLGIGGVVRRRSHRVLP